MFSYVTLLVWLEFLLSPTVSLSLALSLIAPTTTLHSNQPHATNLLADTKLLRHFTSLTLPYMNFVLVLLAVFNVVDL